MMKNEWLLSHRSVTVSIIRVLKSIIERHVVSFMIYREIGSKKSSAEVTEAFVQNTIVQALNNLFGEVWQTNLPIFILIQLYFFFRS